MIGQVFLLAITPNLAKAAIAIGEKAGNFKIIDLSVRYGRNMDADKNNWPLLLEL